MKIPAGSTALPHKNAKKARQWGRELFLHASWAHHDGCSNSRILIFSNSKHHPAPADNNWRDVVPLTVPGPSSAASGLGTLCAHAQTTWTAARAIFP